MDNLPDEVILQILSHLEVIEAIQLQRVSRRLLTLGRDNSYWKLECFNQSRAEAIRRRQQSTLDARLIDLRNAWSSLPAGDLNGSIATQPEGSSQRAPSVENSGHIRSARAQALANWEPGYPNERLDYYDEYIHRHAPICVDWLDVPKGVSSESERHRETTGIGVLRDDHGSSDWVIAPLDDGSISLWDVSARHMTYDGGRGKLIHSTAPGLLTGKPADAFDDSHAIMTETGAVDCVSVNQTLNKAYFAVQTLLHEVDLNTMQLVDTKSYPWPITAISERQDRHPVTVGTNWTVHLHDPRDSSLSGTNSTNGELIGGSLYSHATLTQPGPLSILHQADESIWIAGRFTHLLNYDRRFFPRLRGTIHSGARIACLASIPYPYHQHPTTASRYSSCLTLYTAGSYKGKGSLELYNPATTPLQTYKNRQTASSSKLLSVAPHGGTIVFSDGDGHLKWVERDGFTPVRTININDLSPSSSSPNTPTTASPVEQEGGVFDAGEKGDIIQKIIPCYSPSHSSARPSISSATASSGEGGYKSGRRDINQSDLLIWTGDGKIGKIHFGAHSSNREGDEFVDALEHQQNQSVEERARGDAERQYGMAMRRALERMGDEVRFVRGLGMF